MSDANLAQLLSTAAFGLLLAGLAAKSEGDDAVATKDFTYTDTKNKLRTVAAGHVVPSGVTAPQDAVRSVRRSWLGAIVAGDDHRMSTSKTVAFAWTLAVLWGLLALLIARWLGDPGPWDQQVRNGLQEEYLLLLGGPYAAAVLAKVATSAKAGSKAPGAVGGSNPTQLVNDDQGNTDLGDFQYVLFNIIGLLFFFGDFISRLDHGFPHLPSLLTGLMLTSTAGYTAKKVFLQDTPALLSVMPPGAHATGTVTIYGSGLLVPPAAGDSDAPLLPEVFVGAAAATITAHSQVLGNDNIEITVPAVAAGSQPIVVIRADGARADGPGGAQALAFTVTT